MITTIAFEFRPQISFTGAFGQHPPTMHHDEYGERCSCGDKPDEDLLVLAAKGKALRMGEAFLVEMLEAKATDEDKAKVWTDLVHPNMEVHRDIRNSWCLGRAAERLGLGVMILLADP